MVSDLAEVGGVKIVSIYFSDIDGEGMKVLSYIWGVNIIWYEYLLRGEMIQLIPFLRSSLWPTKYHDCSDDAYLSHAISRENTIIMRGWIGYIYMSYEKFRTVKIRRKNFGEEIFRKIFKNLDKYCGQNMKNKKK